MDSRSLLGLCSAALVALAGCSSGSLRRYPLREPLRVDDDTHPFAVDCRMVGKDKKKPKHPVCTPEEYESPFVWDGVDNMTLRPISRFFAVDPAGEAVDVNAMDEVPDSSWFQNRIGVRAMTTDEIVQGNCDEKQLDVNAPDATWVIDQGKENGANPGFRVNVPGLGKFLLKADESDHPERATGATAIATRLYHAAGYWTGCDTVLYVRRSILALTPGLKYSDNTGVSRTFGDKQLEKVLRGAARRGELYRLVASKWLPGATIGPFRYEGTRKDDPNDVIRHEDRRELRGQRLLAAWLNHFDSREQNSMNTWVAANPKAPESSPGYVRHWIIDLNDCFGSEWSWDGLTKRINASYYFDGGDIAQDFLTLGIPERPWDNIERSEEGDIFGYYEAEQFQAEDWKPGYQNPAFSRMTERDGAWMARILARFAPRHVEAAVSLGEFSQPKHSAYLVRTLLARQHKILARYFAKVSPVTDLAVKGNELCAVDLARATQTYPDSAFRYTAAWRWGDSLEKLAGANVRAFEEGRVCVTLPRLGQDGGVPDDDPSRYVQIELRNGQSAHGLKAYLYDLGPTRGHRLVGIER